MISTPWHFTLGNFRCIAIRDGGHMGSADFLFCNAPQLEVAQVLQKHALEPEQLKSSWTCLLVDTGEKTLLVDTGIGSGVPDGGTLVSQLAQEGYPKDIPQKILISCFSRMVIPTTSADVRMKTAM